MRNLFLLIALCCVAFSVRAQRLVEVGKGFSSTSVNTTVFRNNSIVTHGNTQYISYYDAEGWLMLGKRRLGHWGMDFAPYPIQRTCKRCT